MRVVVAVIVAALVGLGVIAGGLWWLGRGLTGPSPEDLAAGTAEDYLAAWQASSWPAMAALAHDHDARSLAEAHEELLGGLAVDAMSLSGGAVTVDDGVARAPFTVTLELEGLGEWSYQAGLTMVWDGDDWLVDWSPSTVHPVLREGHRLVQSVDWSERESILAHDGAVLSGRGELVAVGFEPRRVEDAELLAERLAAHTGADEESVLAELGRDDLVDDWFYPVAELRPQEADGVREELAEVEGVVFRDTTARIAPAEGFARHVLGRTGEVTAELLDELGPPYAAGAVVGRAGLELVYQQRLAGEPDGQVRVEDGDGDVVDVLARFPGRAPRAVRTTLDVDVQTAAEAALDGTERPAALVVVDAPTGHLRAIASRPVDDFDRALGARYAPGSTFKVVTAAALLDAGVDPGDEVECPAQAAVGGRTFRNAGDRDLGTVPFVEAFAESCNTTFVTLGEALSEDALAEAAGRFGFDQEPDLPLPAAAPRFPAPGDTVERAAAAIGQGRVEASPAHMASVAAAVASGAWRSPVLVTDDGDDPPSAEPDAPIPQAEALADLMRAAVAQGTGQAAAVEGDPVAGKTGTAEFDGGEAAHAWFIGFRGDLAFAVLVEEGGAGGEVAAPLAADFLEALG